MAADATVSQVAAPPQSACSQPCLPVDDSADNQLAHQISHYDKQKIIYFFSSLLFHFRRRRQSRPIGRCRCPHRRRRPLSVSSSSSSSICPPSSATSADPDRSRNIYPFWMCHLQQACVLMGPRSKLTKPPPPPPVAYASCVSYCFCLLTIKIATRAHLVS